MGNDTQLSVLYESSSGDFQDYEDWASVEHAYVDFSDGSDENMVVEYARLNSSTLLCEAVVRAANKTSKTKPKTKTTVRELFPDFYNLKHMTCETVHADLATFERVPWATLFDAAKGEKYTRTGLVTKCSSCKSVIPDKGANKPSETKPAWVCKSLALDLPCAKDCFQTGIACHGCHQKHACRDSPDRRGRRREKKEEPSP